MMNEFDPVIGYVDIKAELERLCDIITDPDKYAKLGISVPIGLMLHGEPGVGKTLLATCFTKATGRPVFTIRKDKPDGEFVNSIRSTFAEAADNAPSIVFLDDMDKFANQDDLHPNTEEYITIQSCIDAVKGRNVFILATANDLENLPESLLRAGRFDKVIEMEAPKGDDAELIVKHYLDSKSFVEDIDAREVARLLDGSSCAELETVINEAGIYAGFRGSDKIEMEDVIRACMRVIFRAPEHIKPGDDKFITETAYHEAGHAVVAEMLEPESVNLISVCAHTGSIGGVTSHYQDESYGHSMEMMENRVMALLAGRAAVELVFGKIDTGAASDIGRAFSIVGRFVSTFCVDGFEYYEPHHSGSEDLMHKQEQSIALKVAMYYNKAKQILMENRSFLDGLADELVEKKVLIARDIQRIKTAA